MTNTTSKLRNLTTLATTIGLLAACGVDARPEMTSVKTPETAPEPPAPDDATCGEFCDILSLPDAPADDLVCDAGESVCDDSCVALSSDADNCGACGNSCGEQSCSDAICNAHLTSGRLVATLFARATDVAVAEDGGSVIVGSFGGTMELVGPQIMEAAGVDGFVAKIAANGTLVWLTQLASTDEMRPTSVAVDGDAIAVGGLFSGKIDMGAGFIESVALEDAFVAMFDAEGVSQWITSFGDVVDGMPPSSDEVQEIRSLAFARDGGLVIAGGFYGSIRIDGDVYAAQGDEELLLAKLNRTSGVAVWSRAVLGPGGQHATDVVATDDGIYVVGGFTQTLNLDSGVQHVAIGGSEAFVAHYHDDGGFVWAQAWLGSGNDRATSVAASRHGIVVVGDFAQQLETPGDTFATAEDNGVDMFAAHLTAEGDLIRAGQFGKHGTQTPRSVAVSDAGEIWIVGEFSGALDFGMGTLSAQGTDAFVARLDEELGPIWSHRFGDAEAQRATGVSCAPDGRAAVVGTYEGQLDLGGGVTDSGASTSAFYATFGDAE